MLKYFKKIQNSSLELLKNVRDKGFFHLLVANFFINFFAFGSQLVVAWILTPTQIGQIKILQTFVSIAVLLVNFGFEASVLKLCSENISAETKRRIFKSANIFSIFTSIITFFIILIVGNLNVVSKDQFINNWFIIFLFASIPFALNSLNFSYLQALKKFEILSKLQASTKLFSILLIIILTYIYSINGYIYAILIGYIITMLILYWYNSRELVIPIKRLFLRKEFRNHFRYSKYAFSANLISNLTRYLDIFIINFFILDREVVGMYSFAINVILFLQIISDTIQKITTPHFSEKSSNSERWLHVYNYYFRLYIVFGLFLLVLMNLFINPTISFIFSGKYDASIIFIHILTIRWFFYALVQFKSSAVFGLGKLNYNMWGSIIYLIINFLVQFVLLNFYGILGVAVGVSISAVIYFVIYSFMIKSIVRKNIS